LKHSEATFIINELVVEIAMILCVDDRADGLAIRKALLEQLGYDTLTAESPDEAIEMAQKYRISLVLLDYNFAGQMTGDELARKLREIIPGVPLVMLSGYPNVPEHVTSTVDVFLVKGRLGELITTIQTFLGPSNRKLPQSVQTATNLVEESRKLLERRKRGSC
jgi:two-component system, NtrC family, response regulator AtoC